MKQFLYIISAAVIGSFITVFSMKQLGYLDGGAVQIQQLEQMPVKKAVYTTDSDGNMIPLDFRGTSKKVMPAVVHIKSIQSVQQTGNNYQDVHPYFRDFFDMFEEQSPRARMGSGSGVIISPDGYIVTNNHVIDGADEIKVNLNDNRSFTAKLIGTDPQTDIAVIKIDESELAFLPFMNSDQVEVGDWVLAVGNPFNLNSTVTAGIVSAKGRDINILQGNSAIESFIQTDAAINPGNSGGALVDLQGGLIGINTAIASPTGSYTGYGFAVPSNIVQKIVEDIVEFGVVQRGFLGVMIKSIDGDLAEEKDLDITEGVFVESIMSGSGAEEAGMQEGDVIVKVDGKEVKSAPALQEAIGRHRPGDQVDVLVLRDGSEKSLNVTLLNKENSTQIIHKEEQTLYARLGADFREIDEDLAAELGVDGGIQIVDIRDGKIKRETGLRSGFIITSVDKKKVSTLEQFKERLSEADQAVFLGGYYKGNAKPIYLGMTVE